VLRLGWVPDVGARLVWFWLFDMFNRLMLRFKLRIKKI
jgi:hypothetical protein